MAAEVLGNRYRLDEPVGAGGMGQVWRAYDQTLDRVVAVKVIAGLNAAPEAAARLRREARAAAKLTGPHVAAVHDYGRDDAANRDYIVTEFITGTDLGSRVREHGPQDPDDVAVRGGHRHARLHVTRTGRGSGRRPPQRPVLPRLHVLRAADGPAALHREGRHPPSRPRPDAAASTEFDPCRSSGILGRPRPHASRQGSRPPDPERPGPAGPRHLRLRASVSTRVPAEPTCTEARRRVDGTARRRGQG